MFLASRRWGMSGSRTDSRHALLDSRRCGDYTSKWRMTGKADVMCFAHVSSLHLILTSAVALDAAALGLLVRAPGSG